MAGNSGKAVINFGAFPGSGHATVVVSGMAASQVRAESVVQVFIGSDETPEHSADEHALARISLSADTIVPGESFRVVGVANERTPLVGASKGKPHRLYGSYSIAFVY
jgi:hypothetical protein